METIAPRPLLTRKGLLKWLGVTEFWLRTRLESDPDFPVIDLAPDGAERRTLRFDTYAVARHLGIPVPPSYDDAPATRQPAAA